MTASVAGPPGGYVERVPIARLRRWVRTCWIQSSGSDPVVQRTLPTGGMELRCVLGGHPYLFGPLTAVDVAVLSAGTTLLGLRLWPGVPTAAFGDPGRTAALPADELTDRAVPLADLRRTGPARLVGLLAVASDAAAGLRLLERLLVELLAAVEGDDLVASAAARLMPWRSGDVASVAREHDLSTSQLRRRFLAGIGVTPKVLQRTLRFQGYLALAQEAAAGPRDRPRTADLAALAGYADQPHLARECLRLSGRTPRELLGAEEACGCGHDHTASYRPFLGGRMPLRPIG